MSLVWDSTLGGDPGPPPPGAPDGTRGPRIPDDWCRRCWQERLVWQDGVWMLEHIGPFANCTHSCHDGHSFLDSTS